MKRKNTIFAVIILAAIPALLLSGCSNASLQTRTDDVSNFDRIQINTFGEFIIEQGNEESLTIEAPRDYLRYITSDVQNNTLMIDTRRGFIGGPIQRVIYTITVKDLEKISLEGAGAIKIFELDTDDLEINLTGAGSVEVDDPQSQHAGCQPEFSRRDHHCGRGGFPGSEYQRHWQLRSWRPVQQRRRDPADRRRQRGCLGGRLAGCRGYRRWLSVLLRREP